jgi:hypothetical protein
VPGQKKQEQTTGCTEIEPFSLFLPVDPWYRKRDGKIKKRSKFISILQIAKP